MLSREILAMLEELKKVDKPDDDDAELYAQHCVRIVERLLVEREKEAALGGRTT